MRSDSASRALVASSNRSIFGSFKMALAIAIRCFCPPDSCVPLSPTSCYLLTKGILDQYGILLSVSLPRVTRPDGAQAIAATTPTSLAPPKLLIRGPDGCKITKMSIFRQGGRWLTGGGGEAGGQCTWWSGGCKA
uniref:Uncharacterized protein n=1 Tax=Oryza glumipatula TaxID=40148 RepID=A0A0D9YDK5_9ORYZ